MAKNSLVWNSNRKKDILLEERGRSLASQGKFYEAITVLEELDTVEDSDIGIELLMIDCYLQLGRENKADRIINHVREIIFSKPMCDVNDVIELADHFIEDSCTVRALILFRIASDMYIHSSASPAEAMDGIFRCMQKMQNPVREMLNFDKEPKGTQDLAGLFKSLQHLLNTGDISRASHPKKWQRKSARSRIIAIDFGVEYMMEMLDSLRTLKEVDLDEKALKMAWCSNYIGYNYAQVDEYRKTLKILNNGIDNLEKHFGKQASIYNVYGTLLTNAGAALHNLQKYGEAEKIKVRALTAKEDATDYKDRNERKRAIEEIRDSLKITRQHMTM
ncbi:uncharacterized protein LOC144425050 [Styela clava]